MIDHGATVGHNTQKLSATSQLEQTICYKQHKYTLCDTSSKLEKYVQPALFAHQERKNCINCA